LIIPSDMLPTYVPLPEDTILHEKPQLEDAAPTEVDSIEEQILLLGHIELLRKSTPDTEIRREQISAYLERFLAKSLDFLVFSKGLYLRSINEFSSYKKRERALLQLEELIIQFNQLEKNKPREQLTQENAEKKELGKENLQMKEESWRRVNFFSVWYPDFITLQKTLAEKYMAMGCVMSSCQLFEKIGELEQCVECLAMAGHVTEARERAAKLIGEGRKTPKLLCILGDINNGDKVLYKEAWKLSNKKFSRAQRSLGRVYLNEKALQKSAKAFEKALAIHSYQASAWFTLGCVYMMMNNFEKALRCFSSVIQIDETQGRF
jgi:tetratricopeptide (TPR) repeat protein